MTAYYTEPFRRHGTDTALPTLPHLTSMTWRHGLFVHWPISPDALRPQIPDPLTLETWEGDAWISVLPFVLVNVGLRGSPSATRIAFPELNVRTYVRYRDDSGLFFFSVDIGNPLVAAAAGQTRLPVRYAQMHVSGSETGISFSSRRTDVTPGTVGEPDRKSGWFSATYRPDGDTFRPEPDTLEYWLTERRRFYAPENGDVLTAEISHEPWPLQPAEVTIHENTMFEANELPTPTDSPIAYYCDELSMTGSVPRRL